jgi:hypothetical protein
MLPQRAISRNIVYPCPRRRKTQYPLWRIVAAAPVPPPTRERDWEALCEQLVVRSIDGGHRSLFEPQFRASLCAQFLQAVETAGRIARSGRETAG